MIFLCDFYRYVNAGESHTNLTLSPSGRCLHIDEMYKNEIHSYNFSMGDKEGIQSTPPPLCLKISFSLEILDGFDKFGTLILLLNKSILLYVK